MEQPDDNASFFFAPLQECSISHYLALGITVCAVFAARALFRSDGVSQYPMFGQELGGYSKRRQHFLRRPAESVQEGYRKFKEGLWRITSVDGEPLMLPLKYAEELRKLPDDVVNNVVAIEEILEKKYLGLTADNPHLTHVIKADLTHNLSRLNLMLSDEAAKTVTDVLGPCPEWTEVKVYQELLKIVAIVSGAIFVGPEFCREPSWVHASINYTTDLFKAAALLKQWPPYMRPLAKFWIPEVGRVYRYKRQAVDLLAPVIRDRRARRDRETDEAPEDMLQWLVNKAPKFGTDNEEELAASQLTLSLAAIHTTTLTATQIIYDIVGQCPQIIPELRAEVEQVLREHDGVMTTQALFSMKLLDSVMRESQRLSPSSLLRMVRRVMKPFTFADGTAVPAGATVAIPLLAALQDGDHYARPEVFDPYRFLQLRRGEAADPLQYANKEQYQFVSVTKENMAFGYGRHACPGRFFAANEIKLICAQILLNYDLKLPEGVSGRYANLHSGLTVSPDPTKTIKIRRATTKE